MLKKSSALLAAMSLAVAPVVVPTGAVAQETVEQDGGRQAPTEVMAVVLVITITLIILLATGELTGDDDRVTP